ncbi:MAG: phage portal protein [Azospirillum sp.]|nr:phage portal protein [Azospirillum sp.]
MAILNRVLSYFRKRSLDAGAAGRRWPVATRISNLNADVLGSGRTIRERAGYYANNNAHGRAAVAALVANIVGPGIVPSPQHPDQATRRRLADLWLRWTDVADFDGATDFYGLQALAVRQMVETGESFAHLTTDGPELPLSLRLLHPSQVPTEWPMALVNGLVRGGIEFDGMGRRVNYLALPFRPDDPLMAFTAAGFNPVRLPVADVVHLFDVIEPGQIRGLSWFAPVLLALNELDQISDAALVGAKIRNLVVAALMDPDGTASGLPGTASAGTLDVGLEPGAILPLEPGRSIEFFDPKESQAYGPFVREHLRAVAAGLGIPYELLTGDLSSVNYSSIRAGLVEFRKKLSHWQHNVIVFRLCRPVWDRFVGAAVLAGKIDAAEYARDPGLFHRVEWLPPRVEWVDPMKDAQAEIEAINAGLMSRRQAIAARGGDIDQLRAEIAAERTADEAANLNFTAPKALVAPPQITEAANVQ